MSRPKRTVIEYRTYDLPSDLPLVVLTGEQWRISPVNSGRLHFHNCLEIGYCQSDEGTILFGSDPAAFHEGDMTCIAGNVPHTTYSAPGTHSLWSYLFFQPEDMMRGTPMEHLPELDRMQDMLRNAHMVISANDQPVIRQLILSIIQEMTEKPPHYAYAVRMLCATLLLHLLRCHQTLPERTSSDTQALLSIAPTLDHIHACYAQDFAIDDLAAMCKLSPTHFRRCFHDWLGMSPLTYLHKVRIMESCTLLRSTEDSVATIAGRVGYGSLSSFNRHFIEMMSITPSEWRRDLLKDHSASVVQYNGWLIAEHL